MKRISIDDFCELEGLKKIDKKILNDAINNSNLNDNLISSLNLSNMNLNNNSKKKTTVVNVKVQYIRPTYNNLKEWLTDPNNIYIGRRGIVIIDSRRVPEKDSIWANPFKIKDYPNQDVCVLYKTYIIDKIKKEGLQKELESLRHKTLGCWCKPDKCHGDVLLELLNDN